MSPNHATPGHRRIPSPSRLEATLLGVLFLGAITMLSLPGARGTSASLGWMPLWLALLPAAALATAFALRFTHRRAVGALPLADRGVRRRRGAMAVPARRRSMPPRRGSRLLAALVLR